MTVTQQVILFALLAGIIVLVAGWIADRWLRDKSKKQKRKTRKIRSRRSLHR